MEVLGWLTSFSCSFAFGSSHHSAGDSSFTNKIHIVVSALWCDGLADVLVHEARPLDSGVT